MRAHARACIRSCQSFVRPSGERLRGSFSIRPLPPQIFTRYILNRRTAGTNFRHDRFSFDARSCDFKNVPRAPPRTGVLFFSRLPLIIYTVAYKRRLRVCVTGRHPLRSAATRSEFVTTIDAIRLFRRFFSLRFGSA